MRRPHPFVVGPGVGWRQFRSVGRAHIVALAVALVIGVIAIPAVPDGGEPNACTAIREPALVLSNLGEEGRGRLVLRGQLPGSAFPALPSEGELRIEEVGTDGASVFTMQTSIHDAADCRRIRGLRRLPSRVGRCPSTGGKARLRFADQPLPDGANRFLLRARGETLRAPLGSLRVTVVFGAGDNCSRWTFAREDCSLDEDGTVLSCSPRAAGSACRRTGCSGQLCGDEDVATTCEYRPEFACYRDAACEPQGDGSCGWTPSDDLARCLAETSGPPMPPPAPGLPRSSWSDCESDDDCIVYPGLDCCGCSSGGGPEVAINGEARGEVDAYRACPDVACGAEYLCRDAIGAVCRAGRCEIR